MAFELVTDCAAAGNLHAIREQLIIIPIQNFITVFFLIFDLRFQETGYLRNLLTSSHITYIKNTITEIMPRQFHTDPICITHIE
jgi:hypothetical protein